MTQADFLSNRSNISDFDTEIIEMMKTSKILLKLSATTEMIANSSANLNSFMAHHSSRMITACLNFEEDVTAKLNVVDREIQLMEKQLQSLENASKISKMPALGQLILSNEKIAIRAGALKTRILSELEQQLLVFSFFKKDTGLNSIWHFLGQSILTSVFPCGEKIISHELLSLKNNLRIAKFFILQNKFEDAFIALNNVNGWHRILLTPIIQSLRKQLEFEMFMRFRVDSLLQTSL